MRFKGGPLYIVLIISRYYFNNKNLFFNLKVHFSNSMTCSFFYDAG